MQTFPCRALRVAAALLLAIGLALPAAALTMTARPAVALAAEETSVSTATATAHYSHPVTGAIEDSGGSSSAVLGQSMVEGVTGTQALVEVDAEGSTWVTVRFSLINEISDVAFSYDVDGSGAAYADAPATLMRQDDVNETGDFRFSVPSVDSVIRCSLYVAPMGRSVVFFITLSDAVAGNAAGFVESVAAGEPINDASAAAVGEGAAESDASDDDAASADAVEQATSGDADAGGIHEFDAQGNEVGAGGEGAADADAGVQPLMIVAVCAVVVAVAAIGVAVYAAWYKPKRARQDAAAAAAAQAAGVTEPGAAPASIDVPAAEGEAVPGAAAAKATAAEAAMPAADDASGAASAFAGRKG